MLKRHGVGLSSRRLCIRYTFYNNTSLLSYCKAVHEQLPTNFNTIWMEWALPTFRRNFCQNKWECHTIVTHCRGNSFSLPSPLKSLVSSAIVPNNGKDDILHFAEKDKKLYQDFIHNKLLSTPTVSVWDPMKKLKLKRHFLIWGINSKSELSHIIQGSRPGLVLNLEDAIGLWEMSAVPWLLCAAGRSPYSVSKFDAHYWSCKVRTTCTWLTFWWYSRWCI